MTEAAVVRAALVGPVAPHGPLPIPQNPRRDYAWEAIRERYVEGVPDGDAGVVVWPTLEACAEHFAVVPNRVRTIAARQGWRAQRAAYQAHAEQERRRAKAAAMVKEAGDLDSRALDASKVGLGLCLARLAQIGRDREVATVEALELQRLAQAADLWHKVGCRAVGDPEALRVELTGFEGRPIEIADELRRDDSTRIVGVLAVLAQAGLGDLFGSPAVVDSSAVDHGP